MQNSIAKKLKNDYQIEMGNLHSKAKLNANCIKKKSKKIQWERKKCMAQFKLYVEWLQSIVGQKLFIANQTAKQKRKKRTKNSRVRGENS